MQICDKMKKKILKKLNLPCQKGRNRFPWLSLICNLFFMRFAKQSFFNFLKCETHKFLCSEYRFYFRHFYFLEKWLLSLVLGIMALKTSSLMKGLIWSWMAFNRFMFLKKFSTNFWSLYQKSSFEIKDTTKTYYS